jgi:hypothetical protein
MNPLTRTDLPKAAQNVKNNSGVYPELFFAFLFEFVFAEHESLSFTSIGG